MANEDGNTVVPVEENLPALYDYGEDAGKGFEGTTADEIQLPFISLLQDLSPQVTGEDGAALEGAKAGKYFNTVTNEIYGDGFLFIPAHREHAYIEWIPRKKGGGFVARYTPDDPVVRKAKAEAKEFGQYVTKDGNNLSETFYLFGIIQKPDGTFEQAVIAFSSTKLKVYRKWNSIINACLIPGPGGKKLKPPRFAHLVKISAQRVKNTKGSFFIPVMSPANGDIVKSLLRPDDPRFLAAKELGELVAQGVAKVSEETMAGAGVSDDPEADGPF